MIDDRQRPEVWEIYDVGVDWLTLSAPEGGPALALHDKGRELLKREMENGGTAKASGFEGYKGTMVNDLFVGWRIDGAVVRCGGRAAGEYWHDLAKVWAHATRLDVRVDARLNGDTEGYIPYVAHARRRPRAANGREARARLILGFGFGDSLLVGSRSAMRYGRLYDKASESGDARYARVLRWECEFKDLMAVEVLNRLVRSQDWTQEVLALVETQFRTWGYPPPWKGTGATVSCQVDRSPSDAAKGMKWLVNSVAPAVERLSVHFTREELLRALGLWDIRPPINDVPRETRGERTHHGNR